MRVPLHKRAMYWIIVEKSLYFTVYTVAKVLLPHQFCIYLLPAPRSEFVSFNCHLEGRVKLCLHDNI